eukprot:365621-Chlamydomonas_euryale.AAC.8
MPRSIPCRQAVLQIHVTAWTKQSGRQRTWGYGQLATVRAPAANLHVTVPRQDKHAPAPRHLDPLVGCVCCCDLHGD